MSDTNDELVAAAVRMLHMLEGHGSGFLTKTPAYRDLREAVVNGQGSYSSIADDLEAEKAALFEQLRVELGTS